jgi:catechol 2,3-dioxygenase
MLPADNSAPASYRLPDRSRVGMVRLQVADLSRSRAYYERVIGFSTLRVDPSHAVLGTSDNVPLLSLTERRDARPVARHSRLGLYHFAILLPERRWLGSFLAHLASLDIAAASADHAVSEAVYLWDPDGLGIEVYADRPRAEWRRRAQEIYMTSEPLDVDGLMASAAGLRWHGVPGDTSIGHMHLHVGSIREADGFYHRALGLDTTVSSYPGALFLSAGGYHHHLGVNTWAGQAPPSADDEARLLEWTMVLPLAADVEQAAGELNRAGYVAVRVGDRWRVVDPWGTGLCLISETESLSP